MADYLPQATGNWSTTTWITAFSNLTAFAGGNTPPTIIDDVYADGKTITIDINTAVRSIRTTTTPRTGGLAGGGFTVSTATTLTANVLAGTTTCLTFSLDAPNTFTLVGGVTGGSSGASTGLNNTSTGTVFVIGNIQLGTSTLTHHGVNNNSTGTVFVTGNAFINNINLSNSGVLNNESTGSVFLVGNCTNINGQENSGCVRNNSSGYAYVSGNLIAGTNVGYPIVNLGTNARLDVIGQVRGGDNSSVTRTAGILNSGNTTVVNITGTVIGGGGSGGSPGVINSGIGAVINLVGSSLGSAVNGITNSGTSSVVNITGTSVGGSGTSVFGVANTTGTGTVTVVGSAIGGTGTTAHGVNNSSTGRVNIIGSAIGGNGSGAVGVNNSASSGFVYARRVVGNSWGIGSPGGIVGIAAGIANVQNGLAYVEQVEFGLRGATPITGPVYILPSNRNTLTGRLTALGTPVTFYNSLSVDGLLPPVSSVQAGVVYNVGNSVGTMAVPSASAVQFGVAVDNTVGAAALQPQDVWGYARLSATEVDSMGDRLRNTATTQSIGYQIASFNL